MRKKTTKIKMIIKRRRSRRMKKTMPNDMNVSDEAMMVRGY